MKLFLRKSRGELKLKKKILFYTSGVGLGGVEKVILQVLNSIDTNKFDVKLALQYANENLFENEIPKNINYKYMLPQKIIDKTLYYRSKKSNILFRLLYSLMLSYEKYVIKKNYIEFSKDRDIVIDFKSSDFIKLIKLNTNAKKVCWFHGEITKLNRWKERKEYVSSYLNEVDKIITICNEMKKNLLAEIPNVEKKVEVIYNPFDYGKIKKLSENIEELNDEEKKLIKTNYIIMVSRLDNTQKDFITLIKAFNIIVKTLDINLVIVGEGSDRFEIENKIRKYNLEDQIHLIGLQKNPYPWIINAKLLVHSSNYEGLPTVLIEALILKKMIVSTDCPTGPKEILENGKLGILVKVGDYKQMAQEIIELLSRNSIKRQKLLKNLELDSEKYNKDIIIKEIENMLLSI